MLLANLIAKVFQIGMDTRDVDVENEYKVLQQYFLKDKETRILFQQSLSYEERWEIAQELDTCTLAKLIVIREDEGE